MPAQRSDTDQPVRVLVVDDEETIVEFVQMGLQYEGFEVEVAQDGLAALELYRRNKPDMVILDWMLPGKDGLEVCRSIRALGDTPIIMLTAKGEVDDRVTGLDAGADDYIPKPFKFKELLARIRAVLRRRNVSFGQILTFGDIVLNHETRQVTRAGKPVDLTPREFDLLDLFMAHPRQVFSRETIMNRIWGYDFVGDSNMIDVHVSYLRTKLGDTDRSLIQTVRSIGYVMRG